MTYRERRLAKAERLTDWAGKRSARSAAGFASARRVADGIPLGQPILVGHHSERRHRRDIARIDAGMRAGVENERKANEMSARAENIIAAADAAIYNDDPDAVEALTAKLARLEAERERVKVVNKMIRKRGLADCLAELTADESRELLKLVQVCPYHHADTRGYPAYHLSNLGGNITRTRQRLAALGGAAPAVPPPPAAGDTATARAGLTVTPGMTTPSRPGKQPRPVWTVRGNLAFWRPLLTRLGGSWYRGAFSFWDDPSADIESACLECEQDAAQGGPAASV